MQCSAVAARLASVIGSAPVGSDKRWRVGSLAQARARERVAAEKMGGQPGQELGSDLNSAIEIERLN